MSNGIRLFKNRFNASFNSKSIAWEHNSRINYVSRQKLPGKTHQHYGKRKKTKSDEKVGWNTDWLSQKAFHSLADE